jgi:hypothetical protein
MSSLSRSHIRGIILHGALVCWRSWAADMGTDLPPSPRRRSGVETAEFSTGPPRVTRHHRCHRQSHYGRLPTVACIDSARASTSGQGGLTPCRHQAKVSNAKEGVATSPIGCWAGEEPSRRAGRSWWVKSPLRRCSSGPLQGSCTETYARAAREERADPPETTAFRLGWSGSCSCAG